MALALTVVTAAPARPQQLRLATGTDSGAPRFEQSSSSLLDQPARLSIAGAPLAKALTELRYRSGVLLVFSPSILPPGSVSCHCSELTVGAALEQLLSETTLRYVELDSQVLIRPARSSAGAVAFAHLGQALESSHLLVPPAAGGDALRPVSYTVAQQGTISGQVVEATTQRPLIGAQVSIPGTGIGGLTNDAGRYRLANVPVGEVTVRVQMIGYQTEEQTITMASETAVVDFRMTETALQLDRIVVTGTPGQTQLRSIGNSVGRVDLQEVAQVAPSVGLSHLLGGSEPGIDLTFGGGSIGSSANIRIRGASSIALDSEPLIFIDGIRVSGGTAVGPGTSSRNPPIRLNDIDPQNIESVEIVKGPSAATLYGTEASNGVINIITKRGRTGEPLVTASIGLGVNSLPGFQSGEDFYPTTYYPCRGFPESDCSPGEIVPVNVLHEDRVRNGNRWFRNGAVQTYSASVSGGSEESTYFFSASWNDEQGITADDWREKLTARANMSWTPSEKLGVQLGIGSIWSDLRSNWANQPMTLGIVFGCPAPGCEPGSGEGALDGAYRGYFAYTPDAIINKVFGGEDLNRQTLSLTVTQQPFHWLSGRLSVGADYVETTNSQLYVPLAEGEVGHFSAAGRKDVTTGSQETYTLDYSATATAEPLSDIGLATSVGFQFYQFSQHYSEADGEEFPIATLETVGSGARTSADESFDENKTAGLYVQEKLSWRNRVFLTGAIRFDDNSAFGQNFDLVHYPKVNASWIISEEEFLADVGWLTQLKLRAAWGKAGQQPSTFAAVRTYQPVAGPGGAPAITRENIGNPDLEPEIGVEWEAGFDGSVLGGRLGLEFTYYQQTREQAIIRVPVKPSLGFPGFQFQNLGAVENWGIEFGGRASVFRSDEVNIDLGLAFSENQNTITDMGGLPPQQLRGSNPGTGWAHQRYAEGFPLGAIFLKKVVSADIVGSGADARATNLMCEGGEIIPGTSVLSRGGGAAVPCAEAPEIYRGTTVPSTTWSANTTVTLLGGDLELYGQVDYRGSATIVDANVALAHLFMRNSKAILERTDPKLLALEEMESEGINQAGLIDTGFARLRRVAATYHFPASLSQGIGARNASFTLSARNVAWLWRAETEKFGHPVLDPEQRNTGPVHGLQAFHQAGWPTLLRMAATLRLTF